MQTPWAAALLSQPNIIWRLPGTRRPKPDTEDSLYAETLKTSRTICNLITIYEKPAPSDDKIPESSLLVKVGDGMNGHSDILHGGIVATLLDEAMGMLQTVNYERDYMAVTHSGHPESELPPSGGTTYTVQLNVRYLKPVRTPSVLKVTARMLKREGRKEWISAEIRQWEEGSAASDDEGVICSTAEGMFVAAKRGKL